MIIDTFITSHILLLITGLGFMGFWLAIAAYPKMNKANPFRKSLFYTISKVFFAGSLVCAFLSHLVTLDWIMFSWIFVGVSIARAFSIGASIHSPDQNEIWLIRNTIFKKKSGGFPIVRVAFPGWNFLTAGDVIDSQNKIKVDAKTESRISNASIECVDGIILATVTYVTTPYIQYIQQLMQTSGTDKSKRADILKTVFDSLILARVQKYCEDKKVEDLIKGEEEATNSLNTESVEFDAEKINGQKIGAIRVESFVDTEEVRNTREQEAVAKLQAKATLSHFEGLYGRPPMDYPDGGFVNNEEEKKSLEDQKKLEKCREVILINDNEVKKNIVELQGLEGITNPGHVAHILDAAAHLK
jgi:hypothetical protein